MKPILGAKSKTTDQLSGRVAVVTGGSSGSGQYTALGLAARGATVVITARDRERLAGTAAWLRTKVPNGAIEMEQVDFDAFASVRSLARRIAKRHPKIDILVNNAGIATPKRTVTFDGLEAVLQINHLSPFLLTNLLIPSMKAAGQARIVNVTATAAQHSTLDFDDLQLTRNWSSIRSYDRTKLMNIMFTYALTRRLDGSGVTANCVHPGFATSRIGNEGSIYDLLWAVRKLFALSPSKGAENSLYAATAPEMEAVSGHYLIRKKKARSNDLSYDVEAGERLWRISADMVGIAG